MLIVLLLVRYDASPIIREVAKVSGLLFSAFSAVPYLRLYYRPIEPCKRRCKSIRVLVSGAGRSHLKCYAFPTFSLLPKVLMKIPVYKALVLLIAPLWTTQSWYPLLLKLPVDKPILLPRKDNLLFQPHSKTLYPMKDHLVLATWKFSRNPLETKAFLMKQPALLHHRGRQGPINNTTQHGNSGVI